MILQKLPGHRRKLPGHSFCGKQYCFVERLETIFFIFSSKVSKRKKSSRTNHILSKTKSYILNYQMSNRRWSNSKIFTEFMIFMKHDEWLDLEGKMSCKPWKITLPCHFWFHIDFDKELLLRFIFSNNSCSNSDSRYYRETLSRPLSYHIRDHYNAFNLVHCFYIGFRKRL